MTMILFNLINWPQQSSSNVNDDCVSQRCHGPDFGQEFCNTTPVLAMPSLNWEGRGWTTDVQEVGKLLTHKWDVESALNHGRNEGFVIPGPVVTLWVCQLSISCHWTWTKGRSDWTHCRLSEPGWQAPFRLLTPGGAYFPVYAWTSVRGHLDLTKITC